MIKWLEEEIVRLIKWLLDKQMKNSVQLQWIDEMASWPNVQLMKCHGSKRTAL